jgi:hypothetical protein
MRLEGTPQPDKNTVVSRIQLRGKKTGPDSSSISFEVNGIESGRIQLVIVVDGTQVLYKTVTIGNGVSPVTTTPPPSSSGGTSDNENVNATHTPVQTGMNSTKTFFSADRTVSLSVEKVDFVALLTVKATGVPGNWTLSSDAYTIAPASLTFSPDATISFPLPGQTEPGVNYTYFIGDYRNSRWDAFPGTVNASNVTARVSRAGTYALMSFKNSTASETITPAGTPFPVDTPVLTPAGQDTTPAPAATKTPLSALPVFCAHAIGVGIARGNKR